MTVYIVGYSEADLEPLARLTAEHFPPDRRPASTLVPMPRLPPAELLFEVTMIAAVPDS